MKARLRWTWAALLLLGLGAVALDSGTVAAVFGTGRAAAVAPCSSRRVADPYETALRFLAAGVQRRDLAAAYTLATPSLRGRRTCADWQHGRMTLAEFRDIDWSRASYQTVAGGEGQVVLRVLLYRPGAAEPVPYLMELQVEQSESGWHVGYFARDRWFKPRPAATPAA